MHSLVLQIPANLPEVFLVPTYGVLPNEYNPINIRSIHHRSKTGLKSPDR